MVAFLNNLFIQFPKANYQLLFINHTQIFHCNYGIKKLWEEICTLGYKKNYINHSFRIEAITLARLTNLLEDEMQLLRSWKPNCYYFYVKTHLDQIHNTSQKHQLSDTTTPSQISMSNNSTTRLTNFESYFYPYPIIYITIILTCVYILSIYIRIQE